MPENGVGSPRLEVASAVERGARSAKSTAVVAAAAPPAAETLEAGVWSDRKGDNWTPKLELSSTDPIDGKNGGRVAAAGSKPRRETQAGAAPLACYFVSAVAAGSGVLLAKVDTRICQPSPSRT